MQLGLEYNFVVYFECECFGHVKDTICAHKNIVQQTGSVIWKINYNGCYMSWLISLSYLSDNDNI